VDDADQFALVELQKGGLEQVGYGVMAALLCLNHNLIIKFIYGERRILKSWDCCGGGGNVWRGWGEGNREV
jgi:hypothetical protein